VFKPCLSTGLDRIYVPNKCAVLREGEEALRIPLAVQDAIGEVIVPHTKTCSQQDQEIPPSSDDHTKRDEFSQCLKREWKKMIHSYETEILVRMRKLV